MMISGIISNVSINAFRENRGLSNIVTNNGISAKDSAESSAVILDVSERARQAALDTLEFKSKEDNDCSLNINENDFSDENVEKLQQEAIEIMSRPTDPFTYEDQMLTLQQYDFAANSPESTINNILAGKAINSSVATNELSNMLWQTITNKDASVTERAENRESALKCAQYIAGKYLDDPDESNKFMSAINNIYEEDVNRDKGYTEIDPGEWIREGSTKTGNKILPPDYATEAFTRSYCKAHGRSSLIGFSLAQWEDYVNELMDFLKSSSAETKEKLEAEGIKAFIQNENNVTEATENAKLNFNYSLFNNNIARLLKAF